MIIDKTKNLLLTALIILLLPTVLSAQETATQYFDSISRHYGQVEDYSAILRIVREETEQVGEISFKSPNLLRIDFSEPKEQVLNINGDELLLWVPALSVTFVQKLKSHNSASLATMASEQGLTMLKRNYSIGYEAGPDPVSLDEGSPEMVIKLNLNWRTSNEGFRELRIAVGENNMIRRITGVTTNHEVIQYDFSEIVVNKGIPDSRFLFDSQPEGNTIHNFLFEPEE